MKRWLWVDEVELRRYLILFQNHDGFDHACYTTGGLQMSNIGLYAALMRDNVKFLIGESCDTRGGKGEDRGRAEYCQRQKRHIDWFDGM